MSTPTLSVFPFTNKIKIVILVCCVFLLNINTLNNQYALDDEMVIGRNMHVHEGSAGVKTILSTDAYQGFFDYMDAKNPLAGGRYRPLSIVSFALEEQFFGNPLGKDYLAARNQFTQLKLNGASLELVQNAANNVKAIEKQIKEGDVKMAPIRHAFQIFWFALSMVVVFLFLQKVVFKNQPDLAFLTTLIFIFHPIHTEVVANIKSRDEIFSLMFIALSCLYVFTYKESKKTRDLLLLILFTLLSMLSKEYAVVMPVVMLAMVYVFDQASVKETIKSKWFLSVSAVVAMVMLYRRSIVLKNEPTGTGTIDVLNDPFMFANGTEKIATKISILDHYLRLLVWPNPLSSDYSYSHYPYLSFTSWQVWLAILIWGGVVYLTYQLVKARHVLGFALVFFLAFFMLINNMIFNIGATMGERLIYHSSLGFCMIVAWLLYNKLPGFVRQKAICYGVLALMLIPMGLKTIGRNPQWKDDFTLFTTDVKSIPNSALTNGNAGAQYYNKGRNYLLAKGKPTHKDSLIFLAYVDTSMDYLSKSIQIHTRYVNSYMNRGMGYMALNMPDSAIADWKNAAKFFGGRHGLLIEHAITVMDLGKIHGNKREFAAAANRLRDASQIDPLNPEIWDNLGGACFMIGEFKESNDAFNRALQLQPNLQDAVNGAGVSANFVRLEERCKQDSLNPATWQELIKAYTEGGFAKKAEEAKKKLSSLN